MCFIVSKFGGSSTANADCFQKILNIIRQSSDRRAFVLSAPGADARHPEKITALLEACWRRRSAPEGIVAKIRGRFRSISDRLRIAPIDDIVDAEIAHALTISRDHTLSRGEYLCALLFSRWSGIPMVDAAQLVAFDGMNRLDAEETCGRLQRARKYPCLVIPGFYGANPDGDIVAFPRNGSDITGALVAAGLGASLYENWTDVPGLMTADPVIVPCAQLIHQIGYRQMRRLARAGAQVLHPACLDPVALAGIPTRLRCTERSECFGTLIDDRCGEIVPCIAGRKNMAFDDGADDVACISVFGLSPSRQSAALEATRPLKWERDDMALRLCVPNDDYESTLRRLHALLPA